MTKRKLHSVLDDGTEIFEYPDGALRRASGAYYKRPPNATPFDKAASALAHVRKAEVKRHREETYQGEVGRILKRKTRAATPEQGAAKLVGEQMDIALDKTEKASDRRESTKLVLQEAGMSRKEQAGGPAITLQMTPEAIDRMYALSMGVPEPPAVIVDAEFEAADDQAANELSGGVPGAGGDVEGERLC